MNKKTAAVLCVILVVLIVVIALLVQRQEKRQAEYMSQLISEAKPYEKEIEAIRAELEARKKALTEAPTVSSVIIGFLPGSTDDISKVKELTAGYDFTPLIILDCAMDEEALQNIARAAISQGFDLALAGMTFDQAILEQANALRAVLPAYGYDKTVSFLLRYPFDTEANREMLGQHGYTNLIRYSSSLYSGVDGQGVTYISYGLLTSPEKYANVVSQIAAAHSYTVAVFDFTADHGMNEPEACITDFLELTDSQVTDREMVYTHITDAFRAVKDADSAYKQRQEEFQQYQSEQQKRIEELEAIISEIYSRWGAYKG